MGDTLNLPDDDPRLIAIDLSKPFPCFRLAEDADPITLEQTLQAEDEV
jgi:hypothetical protein